MTNMVIPFTDQVFLEKTIIKLQDSQVKVESSQWKNMV